MPENWHQATAKDTEDLAGEITHRTETHSRAAAIRCLHHTVRHAWWDHTDFRCG